MGWVFGFRSKEAGNEGKDLEKIDNPKNQILQIKEKEGKEKLGNGQQNSFKEKLKVEQQGKNKLENVAWKKQSDTSSDSGEERVKERDFVKENAVIRENNAKEVQNMKRIKAGEQRKEADAKEKAAKDVATSKEKTRLDRENALGYLKYDLSGQQERKMEEQSRRGKLQGHWHEIDGER